MRKIQYLSLASVALTIAACSQTPSGAGKDPAQKAVNGQLEVIVQGVAQAPISVIGTSGSVFSGAVTGTKDLSLPAGKYYVDGLPSAGFRDPSPTAVTVAANQTVKAYLPYVATPAASGNVAKIVITAVSDPSGALPSNAERNQPKPVTLYAAQTEEPVVVQVKATDSSGNPVANANVVVNLTELFGDHVAIIRGAATDMIGAMSAGGVKALSFRDGIMTDASGVATFTLFATYGAAAGDISGQLLLFNQPAKIVVAAENANNTSVLNEFKVFFYNIAHLYWLDEGMNENFTGQRSGKVFGLTNLFKPLAQDNLSMGDVAVNTLHSGTRLYQKQPHNLVADSGMFSFTYALDNTAKTHFVNGTYASVIHSDANGVPDIVSNPLSGMIVVAPNDNLGLKNLPITANVKVQMFAYATYGSEGAYQFPLKDFTISKTWVGSYLSITKNVDHHVLTWAGPEHHLAFVANPALPEPNTLNDSHTLASSNDPAVVAGSVFTSKVTLTIKNEGSAPVYNVTLADALPAELGAITSTATPPGATYDSITHVITWNDQNTGLPAFNTLAPGASITGTFQVYLRQKPGFAMDQAAFQKALGYEVKPTIMTAGQAYPDPYSVVNGDKLNDVTGTWFTGAPFNAGGWQAKVDFDGNAHAADVIINGVRPIFTLNKTITYPHTSPASVGDVIYYHINAVNTERTNVGDPYHALSLAYPAEFDSTLGRDNPYGRNVRLTDVFDNGLDYVSASPATQTEDETSAVSGSFAPNTYLDKGIYWDLAPLMLGGDSLSADLQLRADLPNITMFALKTLSPALRQIQDPGWQNCAYLDADNLNQPPMDRLSEAMQPWQTERRPWGDMRAPYNVLTYGLQSCIAISVIQPLQPLLEPTLRGEFTSNVPLGTIDQTVRVGDHYFLQYVIKNNGEAQAQNVVASINLSNLDGTSDHVAFTDMTTGDYLVERSNDGVTWTLDNTVHPTSVGAESVAFPALNIDSGRYVIYIVPVTATSVGTELSTAAETYSNHGTQLDPLISTDTTTVGAAF